MPETERKVLCSILIVAVDDLAALQPALVDALHGVPTAELIVADTAQGGLIGFLGDPHAAFGAAVELAKRIPARIALDIGIAIAGDTPRIAGESRELAERMLAAAQPVELLCSSAFHDLVCRLSPAREALFAASPNAGVYRISPDVPEAGGAKIFDAGANLMISGASREEVEQALRHLAAQGASIVSQPTLVGNRWMASATHPSAPVGEARVEKAGLMHIVTGPSRAAVEEKVRELLNVGGKLVSRIELQDGVWHAACDLGGRGRKG